MTTDTISPESRAQLNTFCQTLDQQGLWQMPARQNSRMEEATLSVVDTTEIPNYEIVARRFNNVGGIALKVNVWQTNAELSLGRGFGRYYLGSVGYHHPDALPYCKPTKDESGEIMPRTKLWHVLDVIANTGVDR